MRYTEEQVAYLCQLAHDTGRLYERQRIADTWAELDDTWKTRARDRRPDIIAARLASLAPHPSWYTSAAPQLADHDRAVIATGQRYTPITEWRQVHAHVAASVWERIWYDLAPSTRADIADLAPASAALFDDSQVGP